MLVFISFSSINNCYYFDIFIQYQKAPQNIKWFFLKKEKEINWYTWSNLISLFLSISFENKFFNKLIIFWNVIGIHGIEHLWRIRYSKNLNIEKQFWKSTVCFKKCSSIKFISKIILIIIILIIIIYVPNCKSSPDLFLF